MANFCYHCGAKITGKEKYCSKCGQPLEISTAPKKSSKVALIVVCSVVVFVAVLGTSAFLIFKKAQRTARLVREGADLVQEGLSEAFGEDEQELYDDLIGAIEDAAGTDFGLGDKSGENKAAGGDNGIAADAGNLEDSGNAGNVEAGSSNADVAGGDADTVSGDMNAATGTYYSAQNAPYLFITNKQEYNWDNYSGDDTVTEEPVIADDSDILPDSGKRLYTKSELQKLTKEELRIARNEIYARYGRMFKDEELKAYFSTKSWYYPIYEPEEFDKIANDLLNDYEKKNADLIKEVENEKK